jgi:hypothetical protein
MMPRLFFDMPRQWGVAILVIDRAGKAGVEWWAREVDFDCKATFDRWAARGHATYMTFNGVVMEQSGHAPRKEGL